MGFRRIEFVVPPGRVDDMSQVLDEIEVLDRATLMREANDKRAQVNIIVDDSQIDTVIDRFREVFGEDRIGAYIYEIDGVFPKPDDHEDQHSVLGNSEDRHHERMSRQELLEDLAPGSIITKIYLVQVLLATVVCAAGMMQSSVALVIAGMVIAPLLLPNMSMALGTTLGDLGLIRRAALTGLAGLAVSLVGALLMGLTIPFKAGTAEIASRSYVSMADIIIALAAGAAGALAVTTAVSPGLVGVMVAVALVPPLVAVGLFLGAGYFEAAWGATVLVATNLVCVNLAAVVVFLVSGIRPQTWHEESKAKRATIVAMVLWMVLLAAMAGLIWKAAPNVPIEPQIDQAPQADPPQSDPPQTDQPDDAAS